MPPVKIKYQRTTKGRKSQKVNLMLAAAAEDLSPVPGASSPMQMLHQRTGGFGSPPMGSGYGQMGGAGGPFMDGGGFQHQFYGHMHHEHGSPPYFGGDQPSHGQMMGMRGLPSYEQDFLRGHPQQQQRPPFYSGGSGGGSLKESPHEPDYDALHRQHVSPKSGGGDPNNNCDFSEMRLFNGTSGASGGGTIKSEFPGEEHLTPQSVGGGGGGSSSGRMSSPMTNANASTPDDVLEEL